LHLTETLFDYIPGYGAQFLLNEKLCRMNEWMGEWRNDVWMDDPSASRSSLKFKQVLKFLDSVLWKLLSYTRKTNCSWLTVRSTLCWTSMVLNTPSLPKEGCSSSTSPGKILSPYEASLDW
jgi:hypothetical protein